MPRNSRKLSETKTYHIMLRGNERKALFLDDQDRYKFIDILCEKSKDKKWSIYAYCLMDNHVHLLVNEGSELLSRIMKRVNVSYAYYFNKKYKRVGHLFQDRYKSEIIDTDGYLLSAARYIHSNPVKAGISATPDEYKWSSYNAITGNIRCISPICDAGLILGLYSDNLARARKMLVEYTTAQNDDSFIEYKESPIETKSVQNILEANEFIKKFMKEKATDAEKLNQKENKAVRDELIRELKNQSSLSIREMAGLLNLDRNVIQRIK